MTTIADQIVSSGARSEVQERSAKQAPRGVHIARVITRLNVGGPAAHVVLATKHLESLGFKTTLITGNLAPGERRADELIAELDESPVVLEKLGRDVSIVHDVATLIRLVRIFREQKPDIVHTHTSKAGALGRLAAWIARVPVRVHTYHGLVFSRHFSPMRSRIYIWLERLLARLTTRLIAISPTQKIDLVRQFRIAPEAQIKCIPLGLDLERFLKQPSPSFTLRRELGLSADDYLVGWVGRLAPIKDPFLLVEVAKRVVEMVPSCHFAVAGDGELRRELENALRRNHLSANVHLLGWRTESHEIYNDFSLVLLTSKNEGTPLVLLETMACGKPFVAPDVGGISDLTFGDCDERAGVRYFENAALAARTASSLASAVVRLLEDSRLRRNMGQRAREFVASRYSAERLARDLANLYTQLLTEYCSTVSEVSPGEI